jgi:branched-chain amino acid transport system permease protein
MGTIITRVVLVSFGVALVASTFTDQPSLNDLLFRISVLIMLAQSWNLMANAGLVSLGHSAFFGVGSYASMLAANALGMPFSGGLVLAILCGAGLGVMLALATARLRGFFFAICTLGLSEGLRVTTLMLPDLTGGAVGLFLEQQMRPSSHVIFFMAAIGAVASVLIAAWLTRTPFHYACRAMRNHESAAQMLGIDPQPYRFGVLALSGAMASCAGGITALYGGYIDPSIAFNLHITIDSQIAPILGGMYTVAGPLIGAGAIVVLSEATRLLFGGNEGVSQLIFGAILVLGILFMPQGIIGLWTRWRRRHAPPTAEETEATMVVKAENAP